MDAIGVPHKISFWGFNYHLHNVVFVFTVILLITAESMATHKFSWTFLAWAGTNIHHFSWENGVTCHFTHQWHWRMKIWALWFQIQCSFFLVGQPFPKRTEIKSWNLLVILQLSGISTSQYCLDSESSLALRGESRHLYFESEEFKFQTHEATHHRTHCS